MITAGPSFKDNLQRLPSIESVERIDLIDKAGTIVETVENQPGKQGSLAVYQYLQATFGMLDANAARHGLDVFAEHTADAQSRPGAHPNIDRLIGIANGDDALTIHVVSKSTA